MERVIKCLLHRSFRVLFKKPGYSQRFADIPYNVAAFKHAFANSHGF